MVFLYIQSCCFTLKGLESTISRGDSSLVGLPWTLENVIRSSGFFPPFSTKILLSRVVPNRFQESNQQTQQLIEEKHLHALPKTNTNRLKNQWFRDDPFILGQGFCSRGELAVKYLSFREGKLKQ